MHIFDAELVISSNCALPDDSSGYKYADGDTNRLVCNLCEYLLLTPADPDDIEETAAKQAELYDFLVAAGIVVTKFSKSLDEAATKDKPRSKKYSFHYIL